MGVRTTTARPSRRRPARLAPFAPFALGALVVGGACGEVRFVPSPVAPDGVTVAYSPVEDLTRVRWHVGTSEPVRFDIADGTGGYQPVDFTAAPYPSGGWPCSAGTCYQLVLRGERHAPPDGVLLRAETSDVGVIRGTKAAAEMRVDPPVTLAVALDDANATEMVTVVDWLAAPGLARPFAYTAWPSSSGCDADPARPDDALRFSSGTSTTPFAGPPTADGRYCARIRTLPTDGGARAAFVASFQTAPDLVRHELDWTPPNETAPVVWRLVTDLQIVDPTRCTQVAQTVHDTFAAALSVGVSHELPAVDLAPGCQQSAGRALDAAALADETKRWLADHSTVQYQRPLLVYVNNLDAPLPQSLTASLDAWVGSFVDPHVSPLEIAFGAASVLSSFAWSVKLQFVAIEDPQFATTITGFSTQSLPYRTQLHEPGDVIPLMDAPTLAATDGGRWKVCQASPSIERLDGTTPVADGDPTAPVDASAPPAFTVSLPEKILVPGPQFQPDLVIVRYEVCLRWCDHPFTDAAGAQHASWLTARECERNTAP